MPTYTLKIGGRLIKIEAPKKPTKVEIRQALDTYFKARGIKNPFEQSKIVPFKKESNWLNLDAIHDIESKRGKAKGVYNKDDSTKGYKVEYLPSGAIDPDSVIGEYQVKYETFQNPGQGLVDKFGATTIQDPLNASTEEHREFAKNYILSLEKYFRDLYKYKEKLNPGLLNYEALAISAYSRGMGTMKEYVDDKGSRRWREHVIWDPYKGQEIKGNHPKGYLNKYNDFNTENKTGHKQVQREVNNEDLA